jgi:hypothetical protein
VKAPHPLRPADARTGRGLHPALQVWMPRRPGEHSAGDAEIVVLPGQAFVDDAGVAKLGLEVHKLLVGFLAHRTIDEANDVRLQLGMEVLEQLAAADGIDEHYTGAHGAPFDIEAVAAAADLEPDHPCAKRLDQHLGISRVVAQIGDDEGIVVVAPVDRRERTRPALP